MLKLLSTCTAIVALGIAPLKGQQQEALLRTIHVPGAVYNIVLAMPKAPGAIIDLAKSPEALVIHLIGGTLALAFEGEERMMETLDSLESSVGAFHVQENGSNSPIPVAVYIVPKRGWLASVKE